jgi:hypothetical protein
MEQSSTTKQPREAQDGRKADQPREASRRRFRIVKLEERIAPTIGASHPCTGGSCGCSTHTE